MNKNNQIVPSLTVSAGVLLVAQILLFRWIWVRVHAKELFTEFLITTVIVHVLFYAALFLMRGDFVLIPAEIQLKHVNVANHLTMLRISSTPTIIFLLQLSRTYETVMPVLIALTIVAFLTDLFDGQLSRRLRQTTRIGRYLDSMSDYAMLIAVSVGLWLFDLVATPFMILVLVRLLFQGFAMGALLLYRGSVEPRSTLWGKAAVFSTMTLYAMSLLQLVPRVERGAATVVMIAEWIVATILVVSLAEKAILLVREFTEARSR